MKKILLFVTIVSFVFVSKAQQDPQFSHNRFINPALNPGAVGIKPNHHCFDLLARQQWMGFEGKPTTALLSYNGSFPSNNLGFGGVFVYDQIGLEQNIFLKGSAAYHFNVAGGKLGVGVDLGFITKQISGNINAADMSDPSIASLAGARSMNFDLGFGVFYHKDRKMYLGISGLKLIPQKIDWVSATPMLRAHSYISGGYYQEINQDWYLIPSFLVKTDLTSAQIDANLTVEYKQFLWGGLSYRYTDAIVANIGIKHKGVSYGLAYDFTTSNLRNAGNFERFDRFSPEGQRLYSVKSNNRSYGAVELYVGYCFIKPVKPNFPWYVDPLLPFDLR